MPNRWMFALLFLPVFSGCLSHPKELAFGCKDNLINRVSVTPSALTLWQNGKVYRQFDSFSVKRARSQRGDIETYKVKAGQTHAPESEKRTLEGSVELKGDEVQNVRLTLKESDGSLSSTLSWQCAPDRLWTEGAPVPGHLPLRALNEKTVFYSYDRIDLRGDYFQGGRITFAFALDEAKPRCRIERLLNADFLELGAQLTISSKHGVISFSGNPFSHGFSTEFSLHNGRALLNLSCDSMTGQELTVDQLREILPKSFQIAGGYEALKEAPQDFQGEFGLEVTRALPLLRSGDHAMAILGNGRLADEYGIIAARTCMVYATIAENRPFPTELPAGTRLRTTRVFTSYDRDGALPLIAITLFAGDDSAPMSLVCNNDLGFSLTLAQIQEALGDYVRISR